MQAVLKKEMEDKEKRNEKIIEKQNNTDNYVLKMEELRKKKILDRSKSQNDLYIKSVQKRQGNYEKLLLKYDNMNKQMEQKEEKREKEQKEKTHDMCLKQEELYFKNYQKRMNILRMERVNMYKMENRSEELNEKGKKIDNFKKKKRELMENKEKLAGDMEKEKQELIVKFENAFKKKNQIDPEMIKELFPEDQKLYEKVKSMTEKLKKNEMNNNVSNNK